MKYIISESQYHLLNEDVYSTKLKRRHAVLNDLIEKILSEVETDLPGDIFLSNMVSWVLTYIVRDEELYDYFKDIPRKEIMKYIEDKFFDRILDYHYKAMWGKK